MSATPTLPREMWRVIIRLVADDHLSLCALRVVCKMFCQLVASTPVIMRSRMIGKSHLVPRTIQEGLLMGRMFGDIQEVNLTWMLCGARRPRFIRKTKVENSLQQGEHINAFKAIGCVSPKTIRICGDSVGWWTSQLLGHMNLENVTKLTFERVRISSDMVQTLHGCLPYHLNLAPCIGGTLNLWADELLQAISGRLQTLEITHVTQNVVEAILKHVKFLQKLTINDSYSGIVVTPLLSRVRTLAISRNSVNAYEIFTDEFKGLDRTSACNFLQKKRVAITVQNLDLANYNDDFGPLLQTPDILNLLHHHTYLTGLRLSGMSAWIDGILEYVPLHLKNLRALWYTPVGYCAQSARVNRLSVEEAKGLSRMSKLEAIVFPKSALNHQTLYLLSESRSLRILATDCCTGPCMITSRFSLLKRKLRWDLFSADSRATQLLEAGYELKRPLTFPDSMLGSVN